MVLVPGWLREVHSSLKVQQPAVGTSTMLGPPFTLTTVWDLPGGKPSTTKLDGSPLATHRTLLLVPSIRGLLPATSCVANRYATASPPVPKAHGTVHGPPFSTFHPPCAQRGGSASVSTVPAQPPANV